MKAVTAEVAETLSRSHDIITRADIILGGQQIAVDVPVGTGIVTLDAKSDIRGSIDLTVAGPELIPMVPRDPLAPFGQELWLRMGVLLGTGEEVTWPMGVYRLDDVDAGDAGDVTLQVTGRDRGAAVADAKTIDSYTIAAGTNYGTAIAGFIQAGVPWLPMRFEATQYVTPQVVWPENTDRWKAAQDMAASIGMELFLDGIGVLVMRSIPRAGSGPVARIVEGDDGTLTGAGKKWSRADNPNGVIVTGENQSVAPCRGQALDLDPASATYWFGPYGQVPAFVSSPLVVNDAQCLVMAQGELARRIGVTEALRLSSVPDPRLEPGDTVYVERVRLGVTQLAVLDSVRIPLGVDGAMETTTRTRQVVA